MSQAVQHYALVVIFSNFVKLVGASVINYLNNNKHNFNVSKAFF
jgi:hypothetical protein